MKSLRILSVVLIILVMATSVLADPLLGGQFGSFVQTGITPLGADPVSVTNTCTSPAEIGTGDCPTFTSEATEYLCDGTPGGLIADCPVVTSAGADSNFVGAAPLGPFLTNIGKATRSWTGTTAPGTTAATDLAHYTVGGTDYWISFGQQEDTFVGDGATLDDMFIDVHTEGLFTTDSLLNLEVGEGFGCSKLQSVEIADGQLDSGDKIHLIFNLHDCTVMATPMIDVACQMDIDITGGTATFTVAEDINCFARSGPTGLLAYAGAAGSSTIFGGRTGLGDAWYARDPDGVNTVLTIDNIAGTAGGLDYVTDMDAQADDTVEVALNAVQTGPLPQGYFIQLSPGGLSEECIVSNQVPGTYDFELYGIDMDNADSKVVLTGTAFGMASAEDGLAVLIDTDETTGTPCSTTRVGAVIPTGTTNAETNGAGFMTNGDIVTATNYRTGGIENLNFNIYSPLLVPNDGQEAALADFAIIGSEPDPEDGRPNNPNSMTCSPETDQCYAVGQVSAGNMNDFDNCAIAILLFPGFSIVGETHVYGGAGINCFSFSGGIAEGTLATFGQSGVTDSVDLLEWDPNNPGPASIPEFSLTTMLLAVLISGFVLMFVIRRRK